MALFEYLNTSHLQTMVEANYQATGMPTGIIDAETGEIYVSSGWQRICLHFHRANPITEKKCIESDTIIMKKMASGDAFGYKCANGLRDIGIPIMIDGLHKVSLFLGKFFYDDEEPDRQFFIEQGNRLGFDSVDYQGSDA